MSRTYTNKLFDLIDNEVLDKDYVLKTILYWMSEVEVEAMCINSDLADEFDEEEDDEESET